MFKDKGVLLFLYGTLKKGGRLHHYISGSGAIYIKDIRVPCSRLVDTGNGYPALVESHENDKVEGELWVVPEELLDTLDVVEGVPYLYKRDTFEDGNGLSFQLYVGDRFSHIQSPHLKDSNGVYRWLV